MSKTQSVHKWLTSSARNELFTVQWVNVMVRYPVPSMNCLAALGSRADLS